MGTVTMKVDPLKTGKTKLTTLGEDIDGARQDCKSAEPPYPGKGTTVDLSMLSDGGKIGAFATWCEEQAGDPIGVILDLARLLEEEKGGTVTYTGDTTLAGLRDELGKELAARGDEIPKDDKEAMEDYQKMLARHGDNADVMGTVLDTWGQDKTADNLEKFAGQKVDLGAAFGPEGQAIVAGWASTAVEKKEADGNTATFLKHLHDETDFAEEFYSEVSPQEMADQVEHFNDTIFGDGPDSFDDPGDKELQVYKDFLDYGGATLGTYSKAVDDPAALADDWYGAITDPQHTDNAAALTFLLRRGGQKSSFDDEFISNVTGKVYEWEKSHDGSVWGPLREERYQGDDRNPFYDPFDPPSVTVNDSGTYKWTDVNTAEDGLANMLGSLANSPQAAEDFFHGDYEGMDGEKNDTLQETMDYLIGGGDQRTWDGADGSDDGDGLGLALEAATVGGDERTPGGNEIASVMMKNIAKHGGEGDGTFTDEWHIGPEMTDSLGAIMSGYTDDIYSDLSGGDMKQLDLGDNSRDTLKQVLGELGRGDDKSGLETLTSAMMLQARAEYTENLDAYDGEMNFDAMSQAEFAGQQDTSGKVLGTLLEEGLSLAADEDKSDEQRAAILSKAIDVSAGFIPGAGDVLGEGASHLAKASLDTLNGQAIEGLKAGVAAAPDTDKYLDGAVDNLDQQLQYHALDALQQKGMLGPSTSESYGKFDGIPDSVLTDDNPPHIDPRLMDSNGNDIDTDGMSEDEKAKVDTMQEDWDTFINSTEFDTQIQRMYQSDTFKTHFIDPTLPTDD